jgi:hypothetical protein
VARLTRARQKRAFRQEEEPQMAKVEPYHTNSIEYEHRNVYHDHDDCHDGKQIKREHRVSGKGDRPRCKVCQDLG